MNWQPLLTEHGTLIGALICLGTPAFAALALYSATAIRQALVQRHWRDAGRAHGLELAHTAQGLLALRGAIGGLNARAEIQAERTGHLPGRRRLETLVRVEHGAPVPEPELTSVAPRAPAVRVGVMVGTTHVSSIRAGCEGAGLGRHVAAVVARAHQVRQGAERYWADTASAVGLALDAKRYPWRLQGQVRGHTVVIKLPSGHSAALCVALDPAVPRALVVRPRGPSDPTLGDAILDRTVAVVGIAATEARSRLARDEVRGPLLEAVCGPAAADIEGGEVRAHCALHRAVIAETLAALLDAADALDAAWRD